jgi:L-seryl-tRNA(Ser) seleniumtransferase
MELRELPSVDELLRAEQVAGLPHGVAVAAAREALARAREEIAAGHDPGDLVERVLEAAARRAAPRLVRAINATGIVLHTNLGRAPLAAAAIERVAEVAGVIRISSTTWRPASAALGTITSLRCCAG